jgi:hypothetical protein
MRVSTGIISLIIEIPPASALFHRMKLQTKPRIVEPCTGLFSRFTVNLRPISIPTQARGIR